MTASPSPFRPARRAAAVSLVAAVALWISRASFDIAGTSDAPLRVAMLPSLPELAGLLVLWLLISAGVARLLGPESVAPGVLTPLVALAVLGVPYLPWVPDWIPALRLLAGPGLFLVWAIVLGQVSILAWSRVLKAVPGGVRPPGAAALVLGIFVASFTAYASAFAQMSQTGGLPWRSLVTAAAAASLVWRWSQLVSRSNAAATFAWASVCLSPPFVLNAVAGPSGLVASLTGALREVNGLAPTELGVSMLGILFDQEFGILPYAPVLLLAIVGLAMMYGVRPMRALAATLGLATLFLLAVAAASQPWWHGSMIPGQRVVLLMPLLAPPIAWFYAGVDRHASLKAGGQVLLLATMTQTFLIARRASGIQMPQEGDGASSLLEWMSPVWPLWQAVPTFVVGDPWAASMQALVWLVAAGASGWLLLRATPASPSRAALTAASLAIAACIAAAGVAGALPMAQERERSFDVEARSLIPMIETFDPLMRPMAVRYDPFTLMPPDDLPPLFSLTARPGQRRARQPVEVVLNARFRLPAGDYALALRGSDAAGTVSNASVGLQIGRDGPPVETWPLAMAPGAEARYTFRLPLDAEFVGLRASREVGRTIAALRLEPVRIMARHERFRAPAVSAAAVFGQVTALFHDAHSYPEREGFWVRGDAKTHLTVLKPSARDDALVLTIHSGLRANAVTLATPSWSERVNLVPGVTRTVSVPSGTDEEFISLSVTSQGGFVPADIEAASGDRRRLGAWIAFPPGGD